MNIYEDYLAGFSGRARVSFPFPMALHACEDFRVPMESIKKQCIANEEEDVSWLVKYILGFLSTLACDFECLEPRAPLWSGQCL